jgi:hypothetical protein
MRKVFLIFLILCFEGSIPPVYILHLVNFVSLEDHNGITGQVWYLIKLAFPMSKQKVEKHFRLPMRIFCIFSFGNLVSDNFIFLLCYDMWLFSSLAGMGSIEFTVLDCVDRPYGVSFVSAIR